MRFQDLTFDVFRCIIYLHSRISYADSGELFTKDVGSQGYMFEKQLIR